MSYSLLATVFGQDLTMTGTYPVLTYDLIMDALSNATSSLILSEVKGVHEGDYIALRANNESKIIYYGQIITIDTDTTSGLMTVSTNYIWNVLNSQILTTSKAGTSYEAHIKTLINKYSTATSSVLRDITVASNTPYQVTSSNGAGTSNFIDYLIRGFKLHNTVLSVDGIGQGLLDNGKPFFWPKISIKQETSTMNFSSDNWALNNWTVTDSKLLRGYANELWLINKDTADMENPVIMAKYWLQNDGLVVNRINDLVVQPTQVAIYMYDSTATDNPDNDSIGRANLGGNAYNHNIQFSVNLQNNFISLDQIKLGLQSTIYHQGKTYKSVLTGYELSSDSNQVRLTFGNLRFGKNDLISDTSN